jgi:crotonobetainyl-CoA:carnitine CoA-transferase CaiB-like acyl-CoA transferase
VFASKTLLEWTEILGALSGPWAPVQDTLQAGADPQIAANEYIRQVGDLKLVSSPVQFDETAPDSFPAPGFAEQTDEVLLELGLSWDRLFELKSSGVIT